MHRKENLRCNWSSTSPDESSMGALGQLVFEYAGTHLGKDTIGRIVQGVEMRRLPRLSRMFWSGCCQHCFHRPCTPALRRTLRMALVFHIRSLKRGATTGEKKASQKRSQESSLNKRKCPELAQLLYACLIDGPHTYKAGIDGFFLRRQARCLAQHLLDIGYPPQEMPKLTGNGWYQWLRRWRRRYGVAIRRRQPLPPAKSTLRHRLHWYNVLRLRLLLEDNFYSPDLLWGLAV